MTDPRVFVEMDLRVGDTPVLPAPAGRHLITVLRRGRGDGLILFNGRGGEYRAVLESIQRDSITARLTEFCDVNRESPLRVSLVQAVSKGERMDYTVQKTVELGVSELQPLITEHVVVKLDAKRWQRKQEHWQAVAVSASEQSGRTRVPPVAPVLDLRDWLQALPADAFKLVLALGASTTLGELDPPSRPIVMAVGPEGDFSETEKRLLDQAGFTRIALGPRLLRTETAGAAALSVLQSRWGDLNSKPC